MNWTKYRNYFPHTKDRVYLNHASLSPMHKPSLDAIEKLHYERACGNIECWPDMIDYKGMFRERVGKLINVAPGNVAITECTSTGLNWLAQGLDWQDGDRVLANNFEFPSNVNPFLNLQSRGVTVDFVHHRNGKIELQDIENAIRPETRLLTISFVEFLNGYRSDLTRLSEICRKHNLIFCVDGIQGVGALQLDARASGIDFLSCGGQKWLMWPLGTAFMYIAPRIFDQIKPMSAGWLSVEDPWNFFEYKMKFLPTAERFEPGMYNVAGVAGAVAALDMFLEIGMENIEERILGNTDYLIERLLKADYKLFTPLARDQRAGIVTFHHPRAEALSEYLLKHKVHVSLRDRMIRVAPHFYNELTEIDTLMDLILRFERKQEVVDIPVSDLVLR